MQLTEKQAETLKQNNLESNRVTREAIQGALYLLMETQDYDEITMTDIIRKSGVSRSAVYRNYKTKEEIVQDFVRDFLERLNLYQNSSLYNNWRFAFDYFLQNKRSLDVIVKAHMEHILLDKLNESLRLTPDAPDLVDAMNYGLVLNVLMYWTKCGMPSTPDEVTGRIVDAYREILMYVQGQIS